MKKIVFSYPGQEVLGSKIIQRHHLEEGHAEWSHFPDGESRFCLQSEVQNKEVILVCSLDRPDQKLSRLFLFSKLLRAHGAAKVTLIAPYLCYMRQDKVFRSGEGIIAAYAAQLISNIADELLTVDPHLHRISRLEEIFSSKTQVLQAAPLIAEYIRTTMLQPVLIGPDSESEQWVSEAAKVVNCPFTVLTKTRLGDRHVVIKMKDEALLTGRVPVLIDDIISTGRTMIETVQHLKKSGHSKICCVAVHGIFAEDAYQQLEAAGATTIITTNSIVHQSNAIDLSPLFRI
jgi:ribose-phosphate pyrophosphokinase